MSMPNKRTVGTISLVLICASVLLICGSLSLLCPMTSPAASASSLPAHHTTFGDNNCFEALTSFSEPLEQLPGHTYLFESISSHRHEKQCSQPIPRCVRAIPDSDSPPRYLFLSTFLI